MRTFETTIHRVEAIDCDAGAWDWPFARDGAAKIARHWRGLVAARPKMFNGRVFMSRADRIENGVLRVKCFETDYAPFVAWRDFGFPDAGVRNIFSMAALRGSDGGFILAEMGAHTANAGQVYFPAGTPDRGDLDGDRLDLEASVGRELFEETGLAASEVRFEPGWLIVDAGPRLACMKTARVDLPAREAAREIEARIARQDDAELAGTRVVASLADIEAAKPLDFVAAFLRRAFGEAEAG